MEKRAKIFFPGLNGVRAIAAFMVILSHIEIHKKDFNMSPFTCLQFIQLGDIGVCVFFSLSGFLITYLLLEEKKNFTKVDFKDFYIRRILRIWPLYFMVITAGFLIYPAMISAKALLLSVFFLPNIAFTLSLLPAIIDPIWTIGIEEQFYIFHPHFFRIKKNKHILYALLLFIILFILVFALIRHSNTQSVVLNQLLYLARYDDMMIGAVVALLYFNTKNKTFDFKFQYLFNLMFNKYVQVGLLLMFFGFILIYLNVMVIQFDIIAAILAALLIVNLCEPTTSIYSLNNKVFQFLGRISYGIYLLHKFPLFLMLYLVSKYMASQSDVLQNIVIYTTTYAAAIGLAALSYYGYERYFLKLKGRFQKVRSNVV